MGSAWSQLFPPPATFTEKTLADQAGKVFIVTGSSSGVGKELAQILYGANAKVYIAARSVDKASAAIESIKAAHPASKGEVVFLHLDLNDLTGIKKSAEEFLSKEKKLDVLFNNAGVMVPPAGSITVQGFELQLGTNNVAPFLFTKLLTPLLVETAKTAPKDSVRVVWVSSSAVDLAPTNGVDMDNLTYKTNTSAWHKYAVSKAGNALHNIEFAKRYGKDGIVSVALNPGNLKSDLQRSLSRVQAWLIGFILYPAIQGAYTELYAGLSPDVTMEKNGSWIIPWGRPGVLREDISAAGKNETEGGTGIARKFWAWSEERVKPYE